MPAAGPTAMPIELGTAVVEVIVSEKHSAGFGD
jgi:hypothetical protein